MSNFNAEKEIDHICAWIKEYFLRQENYGTNAIVGISGGKDSTITAALLAKALGKDRVIGVLMPNGEQHDIGISKRVVEHLGIKSYEVNIKDIYTSFTNVLFDSNVLKIIKDEDTGTYNPAGYIIKTNTPARIRMSVLYAVAAVNHGRVANTCNRSENYVGYSSKWGDHTGDFAILENYLVTEVKQIGRALGLPYEFVDKIPEDGMCGKTDEENMGFSYETLDKYIECFDTADYKFNNSMDFTAKEKIINMHRKGLHKDMIKFPSPKPLKDNGNNSYISLCADSIATGIANNNNKMW